VKKVHSESREIDWFNDRISSGEVKKSKPKIQIKEIKKQMERLLDKHLPKYRRIVLR
jgi:ribosomal protein S30